MTMEGEINNFIAVWLIVSASLCYCHTIAKLIPKGLPRLLTILPIICLFLYLPLSLHTIHLGPLTFLFIAWLATFKLLLFAFGKGPLLTNPPLSLSLFIPLACLPIKIQDSPSPPSLEKPSNAQTKTEPSHDRTDNKIGHKSPVNYAIKVLLLSIVVRASSYGEYLHPRFIVLLYLLLTWLVLELTLALIKALVGAAFRIPLEPQFDEPYLSTSLQDFWGRRWNLMVTGILRPTVYNPVKSLSCALIGRKWSSIPGVLATFMVSGLMHELILYQVGRGKPTWEVTCFFLLHGLGVAAEIVIKKTVNGRFRLPPTVSGILAVAFLVDTVIWLLVPPVLRRGCDVRASQENVATVEYLRNRVWS